MEIDKAKGYRELVEHGTPSFPMQIYKNEFRWYVGHLIGWHWHPELELSVVLSGEVDIFINNMSYRLTAGEGFFINTNAMHLQSAPDGCGEFPVVATICFLPEFIGDCGEDLIYRKYIMPIVSDKSLRCLKLSPETPWQRDIISAVLRICSTASEKKYGYELRCRNLIGEIWSELSENIAEVQSVPPDRRTLVREKRLKKMLSYIYGSYQNNITVEDIAGAANISRSECCRCFRETIGRKPVEFLNEYRLKKAVELLVSTDMPITEICFACGYGHISYFGKLFRESYGVSPREYRNSMCGDSSQHGAG